MNSRHVILIALTTLTLSGCGWRGLWAEIPPYRGPLDDVGADTGMDTDVDTDMDAGPGDAGDEGDATDTRDVDLTLDAPTNLTATSADGGIRLTWDAAADATSYELRVDGGEWADLGDVTEHLDTDAPPPEPTGMVTLTATEGTIRPHVELTATLPQLDLPADRTYELRARAGDAASDPVSATAARTFDDSWSLTWERSDDDGATFDPLGTGPELTFTDTTASPLGTEATYRVGVTTGQSETVVVSEQARGWRLAVKDLMVSSFHSCALLTNGAVKCWGKNAAGELGYGDKTARGGGPGDMPTPDVQLNFVPTSISGALDLTCAYNDQGDSSCWGTDFRNKLGNGEEVESIGDELNEMPPPPLLVNDTIAHMSGTGAFVCMLSSAGAVRCWGDNTTSILGVSRTSNPVLGDDPGELPPDAVNLGSTASLLAVGVGHVCAKLANGRVVCWGGDRSGDHLSALGLFPWPTSSVGSEAGDMPPDETPIVSNPSHLVAGGQHTCAVDQAGSILCWGMNTENQCGHVDTAEARPTSIPFGNYPAIRLSASAFTAHYTRNPSAPQPSTPKPIDIQAGSSSTCVLYDNGAVVCWGQDEELGASTNVQTPQVMAFRAVVTMLASSHNANHYCAIDTNGEALCWGRDTEGQLGYEGTSVDLSVDTTRVKLW